MIIFQFIIFICKDKHKKNSTMGCGCKNKTPEMITAQKQKQVETIQSTIKKTVEKYYNKPSTN